MPGGAGGLAGLMSDTLDDAGLESEMAGSPTRCGPGGRTWTRRP